MEEAAISTQHRAAVNRLALTATVHCLTGCVIGGFIIAFPCAFLANRMLIARGKGHALIHARH